MREPPVFLIVDGSRVHTAKKVTNYVESTEGKLQLFILPPYAPELKPRRVGMEKCELRHEALVGPDGGERPSICLLS
jgi:hypothetical protein